MTLVATATLALAACGTVESGASPCDEATTLAADVLQQAHDAASKPVELASVDPADVPPGPSVTPTDRFYISPESEARIEASLRNSRQQRAKAAEVRQHTERWVIIIEQNAECFTVEERANAEQVARRLGIADE